MITMKSALGVIVCLLLLCTPAARAAEPKGAIHSPAELARYLETTPVKQSPLALLPSGARKRFLGTLTWGDNGVGGFATGDLLQYLTTDEIRRVLALFGTEAFANGLQGRAKPLTTVQRAAPETSLERKFDEMYFARADATHGKSHASITALYDNLLAAYQKPDELTDLDDSDVGLLFRAASDAASASLHPRYLDDMQLDLAALKRRGLATTKMISLVHHQFVAARRFDEANAFAAKYPSAGVKALPPLQEAPNVSDGSPTALLIEPDGQAMLRKSVDMHASLRIVVVAGCHFSVDAVRADPRLDTLFRDHAVWLADENESLSDVVAWNRDYPDQSMNVAWRNDEWTMLDSWAIPTFYVFRNGKLVDQWSGWPADSGMQTLRAHLRNDNLID
jgi:hypothetical protein